MKTIITLSIVLALTACASSPSYVLKPWECASNTKPQDAEVLRKSGNIYIYDCLWNGADQGSSDSDSDSE